MNIGIIGAGRIGAFLAKSFIKLGHSVKISNSRGPESLRELELETGAKAVTSEEVVRDVEIVVITIPTKGVFQLRKKLFDNAKENVIIVDTCNYSNYRDGPIEEIQNGTLNHSEWVSKYFERPVIKAFNNITDVSLKLYAFKESTSKKVALPVSGDSIESKQLIAKLIEEMGFDTVDIGALNDSWKQQMGGPMYCNDLNRDEMLIALQIADKSVMEKQFLEIFQLLFAYANEFVKKNGLESSETNPVLLTMEKGDAKVQEDLVKIFRTAYENLLNKL